MIITRNSCGKSFSIWNNVRVPLPDATTLTPHISRDRRGPWFTFRGPHGFEFTSIRLPIPDLAPALAGLRILHLSDLHIRSYWSPAYDELIRRLESAPPDLILFTGDFIDDKLDHRPALPHLRRLFPRLQSRLGTWAILGNHDPAVSIPSIDDAGLHLIDGGRAVLSAQSAQIELIGLPGLARHDLDDAFIARQPPKSPDTLRIVLSHYPDHIRRVKPLQPDLFLAGHTHGGQICLPGGRALLTHDRLAKNLCKGVHRIENTWFIVSRGMGFAGIPVRICCPAEVAEITIVPVER